MHETYLKLARHEAKRCDDGRHFLAIAARAMRQVLVDLARTRGASKRGAARARVPLDHDLAVSAAPDAHVLAVDAALRRLAELDPRRAQIVELRFFGGLSVEETAEVMRLSPATVKRAWPLAKAWLHREILDGHE